MWPATHSTSNVLQIAIFRKKWWSALDLDVESRYDSINTLRYKVRIEKLKTSLLPSDLSMTGVQLWWRCDCWQLHCFSACSVQDQYLTWTAAELVLKTFIESNNGTNTTLKLNPFHCLSWRNKLDRRNYQ